jgi:vacuolar-type H+-ATPase subunit I/STV1
MSDYQIPVSTEKTLNSARENPKASLDATDREERVKMIHIVLGVGFLMMVYNLYASFQLRSKASGGVIGERLVQLVAFIALFAVGYLVVMVLTWSRTPDVLLWILSSILVFGAVFVYLVLRLVQAIMQALEE